MSLLYPNQEKSEGPKQDNSFEVLLLLGLFGMGAIGYQQLPAFKQFYVRNYETIYIVAYALFAALPVSAIYLIVKHSKALSERMKLLYGAFYRAGALFVGRTHDGVALFLSPKDRTGHVQILGATGRGKTKSVIVPWACRDILLGRHVILIDGKGDPDILKPLEFALSHNRRAISRLQVFDLGNPEKSCATNPLRSGSPQQITDRLFAVFTFDNAYYRSVQYDTTGTIIGSIKERGEEVTFRRIYELLTDDKALGAVIAASKNVSLRQKLSRFLALPKPEREEKFSGLLSQIAPFAVGEVAPLVNSVGPKEDAFTLSDILLEHDVAWRDYKQKVFVILIPTLKYQQLGHQLGKLLLQELGWAVGERASRYGEDAAFVPVFLDEFASFVYPNFVGTLNKARSSQVAFHLSHQSLGDLGVVSPQFEQVITTNTNVKCVLGLNDPITADYMARHLGTKTEEKLTEQAQESGLLRHRQKTGAMSLREVEAYKVHPNRLKNYVNGWGVLHLPTDNGNLTEEIPFAALSTDDFSGRR